MKDSLVYQLYRKLWVKAAIAAIISLGLLFGFFYFELSEKVFVRIGEQVAVTGLIATVAMMVVGILLVIYAAYQEM